MSQNNYRQNLQSIMSLSFHHSLHCWTKQAHKGNPWIPRKHGVLHGASSGSFLVLSSPRNTFSVEKCFILLVGSVKLLLYSWFTYSSVNSKKYGFLFVRPCPMCFYIGASFPFTQTAQFLFVYIIKFCFLRFIKCVCRSVCWLAIFVFLGVMILVIKKNLMLAASSLNFFMRFLMQPDHQRPRSVRQTGLKLSKYLHIIFFENLHTK